MRVPIICIDGTLCHFAATSGACFSTPQHRYFELVLLALLLCQETRTLTGLLRQVVAQSSLAGLSRFLAEAPWSTAEVAQTWRKRFDTLVAPLVEGVTFQSKIDLLAAQNPQLQAAARHPDARTAGQLVRRQAHLEGCPRPGLPDYDGAQE